MGTSHSDKGYVRFLPRTLCRTNLYTSDGIKIRMDTLCQKSDELGGMVVILNYKKIMSYLEEALTLTVLTAMCMYGYLILIVMI